MEKISNAITDFCIRHSQISIENREIYNYGFKLIFADVLNFLIITFLGLCIGEIIGSVIFLVTLCGLRKYTGGFHAKSFLICRLSMVATYFLVTIAAFFALKISRIITVVVFIDLTSIIGILLLAPIENANKKLTTLQAKVNKMKAIVVATVLSFTSIVLVFLNYRAEGVTISITLLAVVVLMIPGVIEKKGGESNV